MGKQMTVGQRIILGFTIVILIAMGLGGMAIYNMKSVEADSNKLAHEYVPEVAVTSALRGAANRLMYQMRGYGMSEEDKYLQAANEELAAVKRHLDEAAELADKSIHLKALKGQVDDAHKATNDYEALIKQTKSTIAEMDDQRAKLDANAAAFMTNCAAFLEDQKTAFQTNLEDRQKKVAIVSEIVDLGTQVRVTNFKAQASGDADMMEKAILMLVDLKDHTNALRAVTRNQANIKQIDETEAAAAAYGSAMNGFLEEFKKGDYADRNVLERQRGNMDDAAGKYVSNCESFLKSQQNQLRSEMLERNEKIFLVNDIIDLGNDTRVKAFKSMATRDPKLIQSALENFPKMDVKYAALRKITRNQANIGQIDNTEAAGNQYAAALAAFLDNWKKLQNIGSQREQAGNKLIEVCKNTADAGLQSTDEIAVEAASSLGAASVVMIIGLSIGLLAAIGAAIFITRSLTRVLGKISADLDEGAEQVASASGQVSSSSQSLAEGASEQAASLEETSSSLEEMSSMTKQNAENADQADKLMRDANQVVAVANQSMEDLTVSMGEISKASEETSKIIKTIDEIAFQTNLLALNAAVEAARAGEAGAGFAVVADEVRNLAMRAAEAAKNTADLIETTVKKVGDGGEIVTRTNEAFSQVAESAKKVGELVGEISAASNEQAQGIEQVNKAVSEMDKVTQQNAANAEESASASEELNAQAEVMKSSVEELLALVGGAGQKHARSERKGNVKPLAISSGRAGAKPVAKTAAKQKKLEQSQEVSPAQVIPFEDDDDFKDF
ncbi:methyl-accepting chemotaxis protein [Desulfatibacillum alkenivorans DSM 16219]|jgi:methyl-accepting chemotaxis protein|uniref:Methyl-accepting chemotaxis protein n=1 Tax=Desulfatibacillum alkenivorans DSM 16219 TaxID=1121393 RepID=A0A1M6PDR9_9BACT|nr:methyl-accepting chemotaxis protein [Desulfatibacillum alkenivorans]SHK06103.1 methyl-accepting chemotaxis protein [Desulfatibacillum alkenivorans DSM 16219]